MEFPPRPSPSPTRGSPRVEVLTSEADLAAWDAFVQADPGGSIYQCTWWSRPLERYRIETKVLAWSAHGRIAGGILLRKIPIPGSPYAFLRAIGGPVADVWDRAIGAELVGALGALARKTGAIYTEFQEAGASRIHADLLVLLGARGLPVKTVPGPFRAVIDLQGVEPAAVPRLFNKGTRWSIKRGRKAGISVRDLATPEEIQAAYGCWRASAERKNIDALRPWPALEPLVRQCLGANAGWLIGGFLGDRLLSAVLVSTIGTHPLYLYGGYMDDTELHFPNHVLQEEVVLRCLGAGKAFYDMGGLTPLHDSEPKGVDRFKFGFGVAVTRHLDTLIWYNKPLLARLFFHVKNMGAALKVIRMFKRTLFARA